MESSQKVPPVSVEHRAQSIFEPDVDERAQATPLEPGAPPPSVRATAAALATVRARSMGVTVLSILALLYTLYFARDFLLPIVIALMLNLLFSPVVRAFTRVGLAAPFGAAIVVVGLIGLVGFAAYELSTPVERWVGEAPATLATAEAKIKKLTKPLERVRKTAEQVETATSAASPPKTTEVVVRGPGLVARVFGTTQRFVAGSLEVLILLYFLLAAGDLFLQKLVKVLPQLGDKRAAVQIARKAESSISTYLFTALAINIGEGIVVSFALFFLGMPNPALWGTIVALLEFIPYLGALTSVIVLSLAALTTFDSVSHALLMPAAFLAINLLQSNLISPLLFSRRLTLNPVALFVGLAFWWWIWGIPGAFIAVPLLATFKIFCDHIDSLAPIGEFLGQRDDDERRETLRVAGSL
jgi:predicted PurR-regulated permease PerM